LPQRRAKIGQISSFRESGNAVPVPRREPWQRHALSGFGASLLAIIFHYALQRQAQAVLHLSKQMRAGAENPLLVELLVETTLGKSAFPVDGVSATQPGIGDPRIEERERYGNERGRIPFANRNCPQVMHST